MKTEVEPDDAAANQNYALLLMEARKFREAIGPLEKLRKLGHSELAVRVALIESYLKAGMKGEGEREIQALLKAPGVTPQDEIRLAGVLLEDKQPDIAQEVLEQAVRSAPDSAEAHARLGALLLSKNQYEDAAKEAGRAVQLAPRSPPSIPCFWQKPSFCGSITRSPYSFWPPSRRGSGTCRNTGTR